MIPYGIPSPLNLPGGYLMGGSTISSLTTGQITQRLDQNGITRYNVYNGSNGASAFAAVSANNGTGAIMLAVMGTGMTTYVVNGLAANEGCVTTDSTLAGLCIENTTTAGYIRFVKATVEVARFNGDGHLIPGSNNAFDLGIAATAWRTIRAVTALSVGGSPASSGSLRLPNTGSVNFRDNAGSSDVAALDYGLSATDRLALARGGADLIVSSSGGKIGFFGTAPASRPTGVAVSAAGIHAALVTLGLITA